MRDLSEYAQKVWAATGKEAKREAIVELIVASHGKNTTKKLAITRANMMSSSQMDNYAKNYMFAGEGRNVK